MGSIYASMRKGCLRGENTYPFFTLPTPHRWTAASVGALRYCSATGPHTTDIDPIALELPEDGRLFVHAGLQQRGLQPSGSHETLLSNARTLRCVCYTGLYIMFPFTVLGLWVRSPIFTRVSDPRA